MVQTQRNGNYDIYMVKADKSASVEPLVTGDVGQGPPAWSRDGKYILYHQTEQAPENRDIWYMTLSDSSRNQMPTTPFYEAMPRLSPDGHYVAYQTNDSGQWEVYVTPFPEGGERVQALVNGGVWPRSGN